MIDMEDVIAANETIIKNKPPIKVPKGPIAANTLGRETNISPGPAPIPSVPMKSRNNHKTGKESY